MCERHDKGGGFRESGLERISCEKFLQPPEISCVDSPNLMSICFVSTYRLPLNMRYPALTYLGRQLKFKKDIYENMVCTITKEFGVVLSTGNLSFTPMSLGPWVCTPDS